MISRERRPVLLRIRGANLSGAGRRTQVAPSATEIDPDDLRVSR